MRITALVFAAFVITLSLPLAGWSNGAAPVSAEQSAMVNLELRDISVADGIKALFEGRGVKYTIEPGVTGRIIELTIKGVNFQEALKAFMEAAELTYSVNEGVYVIRPLNTKPVTSRTTTIYQRGESKPSAQSPPASFEPPAAPVNIAAVPTNQIIVNPQPSSNEAMYTPPPAMDPGYGYGGYGGYSPPPYYQIGNMVFPFGWPPYDINSAPYITAYGSPNYPPPPGWVTPEWLQFMRTAYAMFPRPQYITPY